MIAAGGQGVLAQDPAPAPAADGTLDAWLSWLEAGRGEHIDLGLERCQEVAARLRLGRPAAQVVTVAGTNGKGSSVALLESIWHSAGYRVGTYTSPHLIRYNERIRIGGQAVDDRAICGAFAAVEAARAQVPLTYFEFATLAALIIFSHAELDVVILEVGLGGRLDAVNIIDADVALITAIGIDHEDWLGTTREQIALEKGGIMRSNRPAVCSDHAVPETLTAYAAQSGAQLAVLGVDYGFEIGEADWTWWDSATVYENLPLPALYGVHQFRNAAGVLAVVEILQAHLPIARAAIDRGLREFILNGRFQRLHEAHEYILDVAHNPQAAAIFTAALAPAPAAGRTLALIGMLRTKNHREFLRPLVPLVDGWYFADLPGTNGARAQDLANALTGLAPRTRTSCHGSVVQAHAALLAEARPGDRILVLGSFLTVGAMMRIFNANRSDTG
ncbi:MAG: bifunctional tetrahydrofolate synthase/dihydrofolate synthase [Gammaproteobacteria bacterium]